MKCISLRTPTKAGFRFRLPAMILAAGLSALVLSPTGGWAQNPPSAPAAARQIAAEITVAPNNQLSIARSALGKEFLISASIIPQATAATSTALEGKIVRFELFHDGVDVYESEDGLVVTKDLATRRLLATLPIVEQNDTRVVVDFNRGMRRVFTDTWTGGDGSRRDEVLEVPQSRVFAVETQDNHLVVRQSVQVRDRESDANRERRYEVRYFFSPYVPSASAGKEQAPAELRYAKYFTSPVALEPTTGRPSQKMARFDLSKPVQFYYSANTPKEYVEAVKDGILYWNRAFQKEVLKADKAPDGVTAPDARYNIVQWVPWDNAGFAYADILLDPRSGESRHGQAYMTSVFAISGRARARQVLRAMLDLANEKAGDKKDGGNKREGMPFGVGFLDAANACRVNPGEFAMQYAQGLQELLSNDQLGDEAVLRASQDYVREVVAHEVGHVLGLRHNFAGSLEATMTHKEVDDWFKAYMVNKGLEAYTNRLTSTSMMEYTELKAAMFIGWKMRTTTNALPHDLATIQWGYFDSKAPTEQKLLFGTDENVFAYGDVNRFDYGTEPVVAAYGALSGYLGNLPHSIIEEFIRAKAPRDPRDRFPLEQVNLSVRSRGAAVAGQFSAMLEWFRAGKRSLKVENQFEFIGDLNQKDRAKAHWKSLNDQVEKLGGLDRTFFAFAPVDLKLELKGEPQGIVAAEKISATALTTRLEKLLEAPAYTNWVGLDEKKYSFTKEEKELIVKRGKKFFEEFEEEVVKQLCGRLENAPRDLALDANGTASEDDLVSKLEKRIIELARTVILAKDESRPVKGKVDRSNVEVSEYKYDQETRLAAAKTLNDKTGAFRGWSTDAKGDLNKALKDDVEAALNITNLKEFKDASLSRPLREWYLRQQDILGLLPPRPGGR
jgi:hypothetical protein